MRKTLLLLIILSLTISCQPKKNSDERITRNKTVVSSFEIENETKDSKECELSEIADNLKIIRLETSDTIVMGGIYTMILSEKYMVIGELKGIITYLMKKENSYEGF